MFIASSGKNADLTYDVQKHIEDVADALPWKHEFTPSSIILTRLTQLAKQSDFGVFIFAADDLTKMKGHTVKSVRDNVLFEAGLFTGTLGIRRCFIIVPQDEEVHIPSDLAGLTLLTFKSSQRNSAAALGPACNEIKKVIRRLGLHKKELLKNLSRTVKQPLLSKKKMAVPKKVRKLPVSFR